MTPPRAAVLLLSLLQSRQEVLIRTHAYTPPTTLRAETNLVETPVTVRDWVLGHAVAGLHVSDFEVFDNGVPQKITAFSELRADGTSAAPAAESPAENIPPATIPPAEPKFVTFFFDDFHLDDVDRTGRPGMIDLSDRATPGMAFAKRAAHAFIAKGLQPSTKISIVTASGVDDLDFTSDTKLLTEKFDHLKARPRWCGDITLETRCSDMRPDLNPDNLMKNPQGSREQSLATISALGVAAQRLSVVHGTRVLILTSYGFRIPPGEPEMLRFIDAAVRWNIVVQGIDARGLDPNGRLGKQGIFWAPLEKITEGTGGHFFKNTNDLAGAMDLAAYPEVTYLIAFNPGTRDGKFHTLKIKLKSHRSDDIQFRPGYFSPPDQTRELSARAPLDNAVFSKQTLRDIPAKVDLAAGQPKDGKIPLSVAVTVDVNQLQFVIDKGRHAQQIVFLITLLDANGAFVTGEESLMELALTDEKLALLQKDGLRGVVTLNAPAGVYQVRTIIREAMKGSLAASTMGVDLRAR